MATYANIKPLSDSDGVIYATSVPLTSTEADLYNTVGGIGNPNVDPIVVPYGQSIQAVVQLVVSGAPGGNLTYVVMQSDLGDGVWVDVCWCLYTQTNNPGTFVFTAGAGGAVNNSFQQSRTTGNAPASSGSNQMILGSRIRFVGKSVLSGGSSYSQGGFAGVLATIRYRILGLR